MGTREYSGSLLGHCFLVAPLRKPSAKLLLTLLRFIEMFHCTDSVLMKGGPVLFLTSQGKTMIHALLRVRSMGLGGCNPKSKRKGRYRKVRAFSEESTAMDAHCSNSPGCRTSCTVQKGPGRPSAPLTREPLQEYCLKYNSVNGDELIADHND